MTETLSSRPLTQPEQQIAPRDLTAYEYRLRQALHERSWALHKDLIEAARGALAKAEKAERQAQEDTEADPDYQYAQQWNRRPSHELLAHFRELGNGDAEAGRRIFNQRWRKGESRLRPARNAVLNATGDLEKAEWTERDDAEFALLLNFQALGFQLGIRYIMDLLNAPATTPASLLGALGLAQDEERVHGLLETLSEKYFRVIE